MHRTTAAVATALLGGAALAGPLTPPAGPIASTMKTIEQAEPRTPINATNTPGDADSLFRISQPGSYYLTGNVTGVAGKCGIEVAVSNVTIDLMGFTLDGNARGVGAMSTDGIRVSGDAFLIGNITVRNGVVSGWGDDGIELTRPLTTLAPNTIEHVRATENADTGISACMGSVVRDCLAADNGGAGISVDFNGVIERCTARQNDLTGIVAGDRSTITHCTSSFNGASGIYAGPYSNVGHCTANSNHGYGLTVSYNSRIAECMAANNSNQGILVNGSFNRIEANHCVDNALGIAVTQASNTIVRNTCASNTNNWNIVANNIYGQIVDRTAPSSAAVTTNAAAGTMGSSDPNANFSY